MKKFFYKFGSYKTLIQNFFSLSALQFFNYLFPIITLPYVVRVLGPEKYGLVMFVVSFTAYWGILIDYGFNLSATKSVSINRDDNVKLSEIFSQVFFARIFLFVISIVVFILLALLFNLFSSNLILYIISLIGLTGTILFPTYLFQGIEKMYHIFNINFIVRSLSVAAIFLFIGESSDFIILILIFSLTNIIVGINGFITALYNYKLRLFFPGLKSIGGILLTSFNVFISSLTISTILNSNAFILGLFSNIKLVGYFAAAEKIRLALQSALGPFLTTTFSRITRIAYDSRKKYKEAVTKSFFLISSAGLIITIFIFIFSEDLVSITLGPSFNHSSHILKILSPLPFLYAISNFFGVGILIPLDKEKDYAVIMAAALFFHTLSSFSIVPVLQATGSALTVLLTELFLVISFMFYFYFRREKIEIF